MTKVTEATPQQINAALVAIETRLGQLESQLRKLAELVQKKA